MRRQSPDRSIRPRLAAPILVCAIALASIALACGSGESPSPDSAATPGDPTAAPATDPGAAPAAPTPGEAAGEAIANDGVIPEGYPSDVPVYPGAAPGPSMTMAGLGVFATFESDDSVEQILEHYRGELSKGGWSVADAPDGGLDGTKGTRSVQVRARENENGRSEIAVNVSEG